MVARLGVQVPVVHVLVAWSHQHHPPLPVLLSDDGPGNVQRGPGQVGDLAPGVCSRTVVVGLSSGVGTVVA